MTNNFRALCAELADAYLRTLEHINNSTWLGYEPSDDPLLLRARAALADQQQKSPTKHELFKLLLQSGGATQCVSIEWIEPFANAVLARWGCQPTPPADGEVAELAAWLRETGDTIQPSHLAEHQRYKRAAELLERQVLPEVGE